MMKSILTDHEASIVAHRLHSWEYVLTFILKDDSHTIEQQHVFPVTSQGKEVLAKPDHDGYVEVSLSCNVPQPDEHGFFIINKEKVLLQNQRWDRITCRNKNPVKWSRLKEIRIENQQNQTRYFTAPFKNDCITFNAS